MRRNLGEARHMQAPRTKAEALLAEIWAKVLGLPRVGVHDNFFEAGGDSILTIQIVARANRAGLNLSPKLLFQHPTIAELAAAATASERTAALADQGRVTGAAPLTPIQPLASSSSGCRHRTTSINR